jgi:uncharacterized protein
MSVDHIRYDLLTQDALRNVIRTVLADAAVKGLPGEHHFFVTFDTRAEGVRISSRLKASYPEDMTIVLQHQFWDLAVGEEEFDVGLAFNGIPERLHIPLKAVKAFFDPSVQFGLQFTVEADGRAVMAGETEPKEAAKPQLEPKEAAQPQPPAETKPAARKLKPRNKKDEGGAEPAGDTNKTAAKPATDQAPSSGEVVRFDRFRKK